MESKHQHYLKENFADLANSQASYAAQEAASYAQDQVGSCYSQANRLGNPCFDCSGLVYMAYKSGGKTVPSSSSGYPNSAVYDVTGTSMEVGDFNLPLFKIFALHQGISCILREM